MAGRKPGGQKTGGRIAGTPNKESRSLFAKCEKLGIDPFDELLKLCAEKKADEHGVMKPIDIGIRLTALKEVSQYLYPKRKSLEHSGNIDPKILEAAEDVVNMSKDDQIQMLEEELAKLKSK